MKMFITSLFVCSFIMTLVTAVYLVLSSTLKNWSAKRRYNLWLIILLGFITPIKPFVSDHIWKINLKTDGAVTVVNTEAPMMTGALPNAFDLSEILFIIWLIGAIFFVLKFVLNNYRFKSYFHRHSVPCSREVREIFEAIASEMNIKNFDVLRLKGISSPMMTGFRKATVILPDCEYSEAELRFIIKHELYHFKKRDLFCKILFIICKVMHWFNPIMTVIEREIESTCEASCDEVVIRNESKDNRKIYCQVILNTASLKNEREEKITPIFTSNFINEKNNLKHRLTLIIANTKKKSFSLISVFIILLTIFSGRVLGVSNVNSDKPSYENNRERSTSAVYIPQDDTTVIVTDRYGNPFEYIQESTTEIYSEAQEGFYSEESYSDTQTTNQYMTTTVTKIMQ